MPESEYLTLVEDIRTTLGVVGNVSTLGKSMTWNSTGMGNTSRDVTVVITPRAGQTRLRVSEGLKNVAGGLFGGIMGGVGGGGTGLALGIGMGVFTLVGAALIFYCAMKMKDLQGYGLAMTAAILSLIPCFSICCIGILFGIWALVVLLNQDVKSAFG